MWCEPVPNRLFCPKKLIADWHEFSGQWLGEEVKSPGGSFIYKVVSGPCCRLYYGNGYAEPDSCERSWEPRNPIAMTQDPDYGRNRKNWIRDKPNYLSYLTSTGAYVTVRWEVPDQNQLDSQACPLANPLNGAVNAYQT